MGGVGLISSASSHQFGVDDQRTGADLRCLGPSDGSRWFPYSGGIATAGPWLKGEHEVFISGWWYTYPSKIYIYISQLGWWFTIYGKIKNETIYGYEVSWQTWVYMVWNRQLFIYHVYHMYTIYTTHTLVGGWALPIWKMMEFVSWDDDIPNIWKVIKVIFQTTNQITVIFPLLLVYNL